MALTASRPTLRLSSAENTLDHRILINYVSSLLYWIAWLESEFLKKLYGVLDTKGTKYAAVEPKHDLQIWGTISGGIWNLNPKSDIWQSVRFCQILSDFRFQIFWRIEIFWKFLHGVQPMCSRVTARCAVHSCRWTERTFRPVMYWEIFVQKRCMKCPSVVRKGKLPILHRSILQIQTKSD